MLRKFGTAKRLWSGLGLLAGGIVGLALNARKARAVTAIEYGLIAALIAVVIIGAVSAVGGDLSTTFKAVSPPTLTVVGGSATDLSARLCGSPSTDASACEPVLKSGVFTVTGTLDDGSVQGSCPYIFGPRDLSTGNGVPITFSTTDTGDDLSFGVYAEQVDMAVYLWQPDTVFGPRIADVTLTNLQGTATFETGWFGWNLLADARVDNFSPTGWEACFPDIAPPLSDAYVLDKNVAIIGDQAGSYVDIDLKPGSDHTLNVGSNGAIPVAVYSTEYLDATLIDPSTAVMNGAGVKVTASSDDYLTEVEDVNGDGLPDLVLKFDGWADQPASGVITLTAQTYPIPDLDGATITVEGQQQVTVVGTE